MIVNRVNIQNLNNIDELVRILSPFCLQVGQALSNGLNFPDNFRQTTVTTYFPTANANKQILHGLPATPIGYLTIRSSGACSIYDGLSLVLGSTYANLKSSASGITATILFF